MGRPRKDPKPTSEMLTRAKDWKRFRSQNKMSQKFLAEIIGVARRTVQHVEGAKETPQAGTLKKFEDLRKKHENEKKFQRMLQEEE